VIWSCTNQEADLPYLGQPQTDASGSISYPVIPEFSFVNQLGDTISEEDFENKIYVADFFFTSCPTICPIMKSQMLRVYEHFKGNEQVAILSHSIDPYHDSVQVLKDYADALGIEGNQWNFVTGDQDKIYEIGEKSYMVTTAEDTLSPQESGGFIHSGAFILIDKDRHIRGMYDGTKEDQVSRLIRDMELLLKKSNEQTN
jgi:protein SCO1/2